MQLPKAAIWCTMRIMTTFDDPLVYEVNSHALLKRAEYQEAIATGSKVLGGIALIEAGAQLLKGHPIRAGVFALGSAAAWYLKDDLGKRARANREYGDVYQADAANLRRSTVGLVPEY